MSCSRSSTPEKTPIRGPTPKSAVRCPGWGGAESTVTWERTIWPVISELRKLSGSQQKSRCWPRNLCRSTHTTRTMKRSDPTAGSASPTRFRIPARNASCGLAQFGNAWWIRFGGRTRFTSRLKRSQASSRWSTPRPVSPGSFCMSIPMQRRREPGRSNHPT